MSKVMKGFLLYVSIMMVIGFGWAGVALSIIGWWITHSLKDSVASETTNIEQEHEDTSFSEKQYVLFDNSDDISFNERPYSSDDYLDDSLSTLPISNLNVMDINPATGLPMMDSALDMAANLYGTSSTSGLNVTDINPASGLPMMDSALDVAGNPYGTSSDSFSTDSIGFNDPGFSSFDTDSFSSSGIDSDSFSSAGMNDW